MYYQGRRNPCGDNQLFEEALKELVETFSERWLNADSDHPIQSLWRRKDILASTELANLGLSIRKIKDSSPDQLRQNIKLLKNKDLGTMAGAVWEIILAAALHHPPNQNSKLLGPRRPIYDIEVNTITGLSHFISVKNFGQSVKDREFISQFESLEKIIKGNIDMNVPIQVMIIRRAGYPSLSDWAELMRKLPYLVKDPNNLHCPVCGWDVKTRHITEDLIKDYTGSSKAKIYTKEKSYTLFVTSPFYKNEDQNMRDKLEEACLSLTKKGAIETDKSRNWLFIHLPEYVPYDNYVDWCNRFFNDNPTAPISDIVLFQPIYATDPKKDVSFLAIRQKVITRPTGLALTDKLKLEIPVGIPIDAKSNSIFNEDIDILKHHYMKQSGQIYIDFGDLSKGGKFDLRFEHGIIIYGVHGFRGDELIFKPNFPPTTKLALL